MTRTQTPVLIGPNDVRLYNRCPACDRGPGVLCEGIEGIDLLTEVHPERLAVQAWPPVEPYAGADHMGWSIRAYDDQPDGSTLRLVWAYEGRQVQEARCETYKVWTVLAHWTENLPDLEGATRG